MRLQQQAQKLSNDITKLRDRQANRQRELDSVSALHTFWLILCSRILDYHSRQTLTFRPHEGIKSFITHFYGFYSINTTLLLY